MLTLLSQSLDHSGYIFSIGFTSGFPITFYRLSLLKSVTSENVLLETQFITLFRGKVIFRSSDFQFWTIPWNSKVVTSRWVLAHNVGDKTNGWISKRVFQENKARQISRKTHCSYPLIRTRISLKTVLRSALLPYYQWHYAVHFWLGLYLRNRKFFGRKT